MNTKIKNIKITYRVVAHLIVLFSLIVCVNYIFITTQWINRAFPGFFLFGNMVVSPSKLSNWTGDRAGLKFYDQIVAINNVKVSLPGEIYTFVDSKPIGTFITYTVSRDNKLFNVKIPSMKFTFFNFLLTFGVVAIVGFCFLVIGNIVYYLRSRSDASKIFQIFCFLLGTWFISVFDSQSSFFLDILYPSIILTPTFGLYLVLLFPYKHEVVKKNPWVVGIIPFSISIILLVLFGLFYHKPEIWGYADKVCWFYVFIASMLFVTLMAINYFKASSALDKQRAQIILIGSFLAFVLPALGTIIETLFKINIYFNYLAIPVIFFPLSIAYSIVKHKLFDIDAIIQKALVYGTLTGVVGVVFVFIVMISNFAFAEHGGWENPLLFFILSGFLILVINPLRNRIQHIIDTAFFREKYDYNKTISNLSHAMISILNINEIADKIINTIMDTMFLSSASLLIYDRDSNNYRLYSTTIDELEKKEVCIETDQMLISFLSRFKKEIFQEDLISEQEYILSSDELHKSFSLLKAALIIPVFFKDELIGILSLGEKKSGLMYTSDDLKLLKTLGDQAAIAIENANAFKLVEDYAKKLESTNKELIDTQAQLIQAEKMSAIGQLAAGIAHEIRNPLNIIEGARYYLSESMKRENSSEMVDYLDYIKHEVDRTNRLIDNLLKFSKPGPIQFESLNVNNLIEEILVLLLKQITDRNIKLVKYLKSQIPNITGDQRSLWQVFINIIMNSVQAMPLGGELRIETGLKTECKDKIFISFADKGVGIKKEDLSKIFDPFYTTKESGSGLGLSITYKIIEAHKGNIIVTSEEKVGTTFVIELPTNH